MKKNEEKNIIIIYTIYISLCMFVGMLLLCGGLCLEFMMFANIVVTFVDSVVLFEFLGWIKNHLKKGKRNRVERASEGESE